jgi:AcrR family transcriptional regulator
MARTTGSHADGTRARVLDAARELFVERGYAGTSVRDIAEHLGMTKGALYYHFSSKEDLLYALVEPLLEALEEFTARARDTGRVGDLVRGLVDLLDEHRGLLRAFLGDPSVKRGLLAHHRIPARLGQLHEALSGAGGDPTARLRARCALGLIHAGVLAFERDPWSEAGEVGPPLPSPVRLDEDGKRFVVDAALAVLAVPAPVTVGTPGTIDGNRSITVAGSDAR